MCSPSGPATGVPGASPASLGERAAAALEAHLEGDSGPLTDLVREATPMLWHVARSQGAGHQDAEAVVQGVWLAFVRNATTIREPEALAACAAATDGDTDTVAIGCGIRVAPRGGSTGSGGAVATCVVVGAPSPASARSTAASCCARRTSVSCLICCAST